MVEINNNEPSDSQAGMIALPWIALIIIVVLIGWFLLRGGFTTNPNTDNNDTDINVNLPDNTLPDNSTDPNLPDNGTDVPPDEQ